MPPKPAVRRPTVTEITIDPEDLRRPSLGLLRAFNRAGIALSELNNLNPDHPRFIDIVKVLVTVKARAIDPNITDAQLEDVAIEFVDGDEVDPPRPAPNKAAARRVAKTIGTTSN